MEINFSMSWQEHGIVWSQVHVKNKQQISI